MKLAMQDRKSLLKAFALEYQAAPKGRKSGLLDEFVQMTGYNRNYAARALRGYGTSKKTPKKRYHREPTYGPDVQEALERIWPIMDYACGQRLAPILPDIIDSLERHGELVLKHNTKRQLKSISSATIDRLLRPAKRRRGRHRRGPTKPGNFLKNQIPIRVYGDWPEKHPGYLELDLVSHEGGDNSGDFFYTLTATDIQTTWTVLAIQKSKKQEDTLHSVQQITQSLPFTIKGIDCDNGSEFINELFVGHCQDTDIKLTRSRPYKKNDNAHVEQKNNSVVRRNVGYLRYDTHEELALLERLYQLLDLYNNFFQTSKKLTLKARDGSRYIKKYDVPKTPYQRLLDTKTLSDAAARRLKTKHRKLNPAELKREITDLQERLIRLSRKKPETRPRYLEKVDVHHLKQHRRRSKPARRSPSTFVERQSLEELRAVVSLLPQASQKEPQTNRKRTSKGVKNS